MREAGILHKLSHKLGWNKGKSESFYDEYGNLMMSFVCECGERSNVFCIDKTLDSMIDEKIARRKKINK